MRKNRSPLVGREDELLQLSRLGLSSTRISERLGIPYPVVNSYMARNGLYAPARRRGPRRPQTFQLAVNLARVAAPDVSADDVELARQLWREFERAA